MGKSGTEATSKTPVHVTLDRASLRQVDRQARQAGKSRSAVVREALVRLLEEEEEDHRLVAAAEAAYFDPGNQDRIPMDTGRASGARARARMPSSPAPGSATTYAALAPGRSEP